ncbi:hypothetical protein Bca101_015713 [Brassica carinata]
MSSQTFEEQLKSMYPNMTPEEIRQQKRAMETLSLFFLFFVVTFFLIINSVVSALSTTPDHKIKIVSMEFTAEPNNNKSSTHYLPLVGSLQSSFLYKNVTLATSSIHSYNELELGAPQLLTVSAVASGEDLSGAIGKEIMDTIKERNEVQFGSRLSLTDCREETEKGTVSYECDEAKLRSDHQGSDQIKATAFGDHPTCFIKE